jgi:large subunit ribosomal protein L18
MHISAQIINDDQGRTLAGVSSKKGTKNNVENAKLVGKEIAEKALAAGVTKVVFDRRRFNYHGKIKALADAAREAGLKF